MKRAYVGCDIGTSSVKTVLYCENFKQLFKDSRGYKLISKNKNEAELSPDEVYEAVLKSLVSVIEWSEKENYRVEFISMSSALHSLIAVNKKGLPVTSCLTWADSRAKSECEKLEKIYEEKDLYNKTGCPLHSIYLPAKILWLKDNQKEVFASAEKFISIKEFVVYKLIGDFVVDYSVASGSGLFNIHEKQWEKELTGFLGLRNNQLSSPVNSQEVFSVKGEVLKTHRDIPLVIGGGDGPLANLGELALKKDQFVATLGTSGAIRVFSDGPVLDKIKRRTWCYMLDQDTYLPGAAINNGGIVIEWLKDLFFESVNDYYGLIGELISEVPVGSNNLFFLPFLTGERSPNWNPKARGIIFGLDFHHSKREIIKAGIEGISFRMRAIKEALEDQSTGCKEVIFNGGVTRSEPWLQLLSNVLNTKVIVNENEEGPALGAAILGTVAMGINESYGSTNYKPGVRLVKNPDSEMVDKYNELYSFHNRLYDCNKGLFNLQK